jgi:hypothetical protein
MHISENKQIGLIPREDFEGSIFNPVYTKDFSNRTEIKEIKPVYYNCNTRNIGFKNRVEYDEVSFDTIKKIMRFAEGTNKVVIPLVSPTKPMLFMGKNYVGFLSPQTHFDEYEPEDLEKWDKHKIYSLNTYKNTKKNKSEMLKKELGISKNKKIKKDILVCHYLKDKGAKEWDNKTNYN